MHIFRFLQKYLIGFNPRLCLGHSRTFTELSINHSCCVFRVIVLLGPVWGSECSGLGFHKDSQYLGALSFSSILNFWWVPQSLLLKNSSTAWDCYQHTLLLGWYSAGDEQSWFLSNMMLGIEIHQTRKSCFSESEGPLGVFLQIPSVSSSIFTVERIEFGHTAIKPRLVERCSDVCSSGFPNLHTWSWSSTRWVTISFLVTSLTKALLHQLLSLARRPALGRVLVVPNIFHLG